MKNIYSKYLKVLVVMIITTLSPIYAGTLALTQEGIAPSPLASTGSNGEGILSFKLVESADVAVGMTNALGKVNVTITLELKKIALKNANINSLSGALLTYFDVNYTAGTTPLFIFTQKAIIPRFAGLVLNIPVTVTDNANPTDNNLNGFNANLRATSRTTSTSGNAASFTYTLHADVSKVVLTAAPSPVLANGVTTSTVTVQLKDIHNNNLTASGGTVALFATGSATLSAVTDNTDGTYTATILNGTAETVTITGTLNGVAITDNAAVTFTPGIISSVTSTIVANPISVIADNSTTSTITLQAKDANGNNLTTGGGTVTFDSNGTTAIIENITDNNNGTYTATIRNIKAEVVSISGTIGGIATTNTATVTFTPGVIAPTTATITANPTTVVADGTTTSTITLQAKDVNGNNLITGGSIVVFTSTGSATPSGVTDNGDGTYTATLTNPVAETVTITGTIGGTTVTDSATVTFTPGVMSAVTSTIAANPISVIADNSTTSTITLQAKDANGNNLTTGGGTVVFTTTGNATFSNVIDNNNGTYTTTIKNGTVEQVTVGATINTVSSTNTVAVTFTQDAPSIVHSVLSGTPLVVVANNVATSTITLQAKDSNGINMTTGGATVTFDSNGTAILTAVTDHGDGTYTATITNTVVENVTVTATINTVAVNSTVAIQFTGVAPDFKPTMIMTGSIIGGPTGNVKITVDVGEYIQYGYNTGTVRFTIAQTSNLVITKDTGTTSDNDEWTLTDNGSAYILTYTANGGAFPPFSTSLVALDGAFTSPDGKGKYIVEAVMTATNGDINTVNDRDSEVIEYNNQ